MIGCVFARESHNPRRAQTCRLAISKRPARCHTMLAGGLASASQRSTSDSLPSSRSICGAPRRRMVGASVAKCNNNKNGRGKREKNTVQGLTKQHVRCSCWLFYADNCEKNTEHKTVQKKNSSSTHTSRPVGLRWLASGSFRTNRARPGSATSGRGVRGSPVSGRRTPPTTCADCPARWR